MVDFFGFSNLCKQKEEEEMNLIEALKQNLPLRIKGNLKHASSEANGYLCPDYVISRLMSPYAYYGHPEFLTKEEFISDNWEVQPPVEVINSGLVRINKPGLYNLFINIKSNNHASPEIVYNECLNKDDPSDK